MKTNLKWHTFGSLLNRMNCPEILGKELYLRIPTTTDYSQWVQLRSDSKEFLQPWEPIWKEDELTFTGFKRIIQYYMKELKTKRGFPFFVYKISDNTLVGGVTLSNIRRGASQSCTVGYWMGERFAGLGLMREAVEILLPFVFDHLKLHRVEASCLPSNERSIRLLSAIGFCEEGFAKSYLKINGKWEDHILFGMNQNEWNLNRSKSETDSTT